MNITGKGLETNLDESIKESSKTLMAINTTENSINDCIPKDKSLEELNFNLTLAKPLYAKLSFPNERQINDSSTQETTQSGKKFTRLSNYLEKGNITKQLISRDSILSQMEEPKRWKEIKVVSKYKGAIEISQIKEFSRDEFRVSAVNNIKNVRQSRIQKT